MKGSRIIWETWSCIDVAARLYPQTSTDVTSQMCLCQIACILVENIWKSETFSSIVCVPCFTSSLCFITGVIVTVCVYRKLVLQVRKQELLSLLGFFQALSLIINISPSNLFYTIFCLEISLFKDLDNITVCQRPYCLRGKSIQDEMLFFFFPLCNNASLLLLFAKGMISLLSAYLLYCTFNI